MSSKPQAEVEISVSVSPDTVSLSRLEDPLTITVTAKTISSSKPDFGIWINVRWSALDNRGQGLFRGALVLRSVSDPEDIISFAPAVRVSYSTAGFDPDLRKNEFEHFLLLPGVGEGELTSTHEITGERIFQYSSIQPSDVSPDFEYRIEFTEKWLGVHWWTFEDEAEGKMFFEGIKSDEDGMWGLRDDDPAFVAERYKEGYIYSNNLRDFKYIVKEDPPATITFVE
ncbi:uncharacterized protein F4822DRAFT_229232 [Hypoxylon trugodes]|uniref:uncharacterized protein n=1 Tax=Hypoxylon trugodes TaxID=326681 RepID=UPI00219C1415|nr:uncharacterized protein F4822DRAFT_229232 [Hypoxylon trugodes]KAI1390211.1 hypothetical protein F4822DRAFT_229232 [Hypoxylon trugodes]